MSLGISEFEYPAVIGDDEEFSRGLLSGLSFPGGEPGLELGNLGDCAVEEGGLKASLPGVGVDGLAGAGVEGAGVSLESAIVFGVLDVRSFVVGCSLILE